MLTDILHNIGIQFRVRGDEAVCLCPFCGKNNLNINLGTQAGAIHCWSCDTGGIHSLQGLLRHLCAPEDVIVQAKEFKPLVREIDTTEHYVLWDGDTRERYDERLGKHVPDDRKGSFKGRFEGTYLESRQPAIDYMLNNGFSLETIEQAPIGWDPELQRVVFFCYNQFAELCLIDGRSLLPETLYNPRYKVYTDFRSEMPEYKAQKSKLLYQLHTFFADRVMYKNTANSFDEPIIVCEGYKATLWVKQCLQEAGMTDHVVGLMGSSISARQVSLLEQCASEQIVMFLDQDPAGIKGTDKAISALSNTNVLCANYPERKTSSPDDLLPEQVVQAIETAICPIEWYYKGCL